MHVFGVFVLSVIMLITPLCCAFSKQMGTNSLPKQNVLKTLKSMPAWKCVGNNNLNKQFILGYDYIMGIPVQLEKNIYIVNKENSIIFLYEYYNRDNGVFYEYLIEDYDKQNLSQLCSDTLKYRRFTAIPASPKEFNRYLKRSKSYYKTRRKALLTNLKRNEITELSKTGYLPEEICDDTLEDWLSIMAHSFEYNRELLNAIIRENKLNRELAMKIYNLDIHLFLKLRKLELTHSLCPAPQNPNRRVELPFPKVKKQGEE